MFHANGKQKNKKNKIEQNRLLATESPISGRSSQVSQYNDDRSQTP